MSPKPKLTPRLEAFDNLFQFIFNFVKATITTSNTFHGDLYLKKIESGRPHYTYKNSVVFQYMIQLLNKASSHKNVNYNDLSDYYMLHPSWSHLRPKDQQFYINMEMDLNYFQQYMLKMVIHFKQYILKKADGPVPKDIEDLIEYNRFLDRYIVFEENLQHHYKNIVGGQINRTIFFLLVNAYLEAISYMLKSFPQDRIKICPYCKFIYFNIKGNASKVYCSSTCTIKINQEKYKLRKQLGTVTRRK